MHLINFVKELRPLIIDRESLNITSFVASEETTVSTTNIGLTFGTCLGEICRYI